MKQRFERAYRNFLLSVLLTVGTLTLTGCSTNGTIQIEYPEIQCESRDSGDTLETLIESWVDNTACLMEYEKRESLINEYKNKNKGKSL